MASFLMFLMYIDKVALFLFQKEEDGGYVLVLLGRNLGEEFCVAVIVRPKGKKFTLAKLRSSIYVLDFCFFLEGRYVLYWRVMLKSTVSLSLSLSAGRQTRAGAGRGDVVCVAMCDQMVRSSSQPSSGYSC